MINKRLLIKNLLTHNDENSFYDKKRKLNLATKEGKAKFLKHVCALSNSNPENNSFIVVGVEDEDNKIEGVDFYDDSKIQNLVNSYFNNPPKIQYENVAFPRLPRHKVVGLVTIYPKNKVTSLNKPIWKYVSGRTFYRRGSNSMSTLGKYELKNTNKTIVEAIEKNASNNIQLTLDSVFLFFERHKDEYNPTYKVFNEQFVLCWAGKKKTVGEKTFYSRVDIELVSEQVRLFYSALDEVKIEYNHHSFIITEYVFLKINDEFDYYPFEKTIINFKRNGKHDIATELLFKPPQFNTFDLLHIFNNCNAILEKLKKGIPLNNREEQDLIESPTNYLICILNNIPNAYKKLTELKPYLKKIENKTSYIKYKEAVRVLRKIKYNR
ncbi:Putative DNA-binding domain-containing protein [Lutibacter oricola]|uniref:Putative DNA-binding domain-containing protein n=1 Tax=Lutibacter oricola TaxID=762486 RepID=A0A1H2RAZ3_9FLAO|nr:ATP-binding protein [Lutibacter oricola]SDW16643.1 Putative DNA-binding domain-containing protein [Lutibacter oricola]